MRTEQEWQQVIDEIKGRGSMLLITTEQFEKYEAELEQAAFEKGVEVGRKLAEYQELPY